jgi:hypothetical protein
MVGSIARIHRESSHGAFHGDVRAVALTTSV